MVDERSIISETTQSESFHTADESTIHNRDSFVTADDISIGDSESYVAPEADQTQENADAIINGDGESLGTIRDESSEIRSNSLSLDDENLNDNADESIVPKNINEDTGYMSRIKKTISQISGRSSLDSARGWSPEEADGELERTMSRKSIIDVLSQRAIEREQRLAKDVEELNYPKDNDVEGQPLAEEEALENEDDANHIPGTGIEIQKGGSEFVSYDPNLVAWNGEDDPQHPRNWSNKRKWKLVAMVSIYTFISPFSSTLMSPAAGSIAVTFKEDNSTIIALTISIYILAWAIAPLFVAPLSEMYGRTIVLNTGIVFLFFFNLACGLAQTTTQMCIFRFLAGMAGAPPLSTGAGVMGDLFNTRERNAAMALYGLGPSLAPSFAPVISGFIVQQCGWRWVFWVLSIITGVVALLGVLLMEETYAPTLLRRRCNKLRKETENPYLITIYDVANGETTYSRFEYNLTRPLSLLFTHPMVLGLGSFMAFTYGFFYLMLVTFPGVYQDIYGWSLGVSGLSYIPLALGFVVGIMFFARAMDKISDKLRESNGGVSIPEHRLPTLIFSGIGLPIALIWYGWSVQKQIMWFMSFVGTFIFAFSFIPVFQTIQNYLIDMNPRFAASAVGAATIFRSLFGFGFPLFADQMYDKLNYGWGNTMMAFLMLALGIPFPLFCLKYGEKIREATNKKMELHQAKRDSKNLIRLQKQMAERERVLREAGRLPSQLEEKRVNDEIEREEGLRIPTSSSAEEDKEI